jgi:hypothetical protein
LFSKSRSVYSESVPIVVFTPFLMTTKRETGSAATANEQQQTNNTVNKHRMWQPPCFLYGSNYHKSLQGESFMSIFGTGGGGFGQVSGDVATRPDMPATQADTDQLFDNTRTAIRAMVKDVAANTDTQFFVGNQLLSGEGMSEDAIDAATDDYMNAVLTIRNGTEDGGELANAIDAVDELYTVMRSGADKHQATHVPGISADDAFLNPYALGPGDEKEYGIYKMAEQLLAGALDRPNSMDYSNPVRINQPDTDTGERYTEALTRLAPDRTEQSNAIESDTPLMKLVQSYMYETPEARAERLNNQFTGYFNQPDQSQASHALGTFFDEGTVMNTLAGNNKRQRPILGQTLNILQGIVNAPFDAQRSEPVEADRFAPEKQDGGDYARPPSYWIEKLFHVDPNGATKLDNSIARQERRVSAQNNRGIRPEGLSPQEASEFLADQEEAINQTETIQPVEYSQSFGSNLSPGQNFASNLSWEWLDPSILLTGGYLKAGQNVVKGVLSNLAKEGLSEAVSPLNAAMIAPAAPEGFFDPSSKTWTENMPKQAPEGTTSKEHYEQRTEKQRRGDETLKRLQSQRRTQGN